MVFKRLPL